MQEGRTMQFPRSQEEKKGVMALLRAHHPLVSTLLYFSSHVTTRSPVPKRVLTLLQLQHLTQSPGCPSGLGFCDLRDQLPATSLDDF